MWINFHSNVYNVEKSICQKHFEQQFTGKYFERWFVLLGLRAWKPGKKFVLKLNCRRWVVYRFDIYLWRMWSFSMAFTDSVMRQKINKYLMNFKPCNHNLNFLDDLARSAMMSNWKMTVYKNVFTATKKNAHWKLYIVHTK